MPTSTPWRNRQGDGNDSLQSPERPSVDSIERLSPVPFLSPQVSDYHPTRQYTREQQLFGLGLSGPSSLVSDFPVAQPDHLYIDQDGGAHIGGKVRATARSSHTAASRSRDGRNGEARPNRKTSKQSKLKGHTRSGSTIDDLANVAIATSPSFDNGSPTFPFGNSSSGLTPSRPATSYMSGYNDDRPAKRVKSERLQAMEWSTREERPRTSHTIQPQTSWEEAELLLGLRNGYSFSTTTSPVFAPASTFQPPVAADMVPVPTLSNAAAVTEPEPEQEKDGDESIEQDIAQNNTELPQPIDILDNADKMDVDPPPTAKETAQTTQQQDQHQVEIPVVDSEELKKPHVVEATSITKSPSEVRPATNAKKPRKIKPEIQAEVCAACQKLQRENNGDDATTQWICCDYCTRWFHLACGGFKDKAETRSVDKFVCKECEPQHGQTTFVRKSSRVRTAIDYAGLNQGLVKSAEDSSMHHYIQPIKDGTIKYLPDDFARVRPELLTAEFWENMDNTKRPFVVPACWNPRFGVSKETELTENDKLEAEPYSEPSFITFDSDGNVPKGIATDSRPTQDIEMDNATEETVMECDQDYLGMVMPRNLTVRRVAELYGPEQPVPVIDVKTQETKGHWTLSDWADYYEQQGEKPVRNVISLEVSNSPIGKLIRRPRAVRDIDLEDHVWDNETRTSSNKRPVQFYCLMSVADSYTDFHIDFGGSSVYYHILKGIKTFFFIPPEEKYLKEYEKWCNSDTQNDTWLGDLCNGNVTRVDLHEGDTAFIPAGWMHSVWTPEDSLVIGGNFLTRLDYDLQLRVANIEKVTKVPQKFRYPFFQKVMWYALLKYLEDDPVPEEVLKDFHSDEDYRYLRANPIWHEYGELASDAEPGDPGYNTRTYPKSELQGLPHLRDYLYRTACIHADIPVPDINKKQIDAVKASIPKGHGDPMRLIKTFAVWCAWKQGNVTVPRWVHDQGDGLSGEIKEREKAKEEVFRVPPERVSARNASKVKAASPAVEVVTTPAKAVSTASVDGNDTSSTKSRSGSRGGSLRIACEGCRKRRIKCRHKEGDDTAANSSPPEIRPRTYSNVSVEMPMPKLASASPVQSAFDTVTNMNGVFPEFNNTSDLAQAALATLHSQSSDSNQATATTPSSSSTKKGRSKACEECRKSKRRCVHDEHGRIDPAKAAEPSKPRGSTNPKRNARLSDELPAKRHKVESDADFTLNDITNSSDFDMMIDPALMGDSLSNNAIHPPTETIVTQDDANIEYMRSSIPPLPILPQEEMTDIDHSFGGVPEALSQHALGSNDRKIDLHVAISENTGSVLSHLPAHMRRSPDLDISYSPITVDGVTTDFIDKPDVKMEETDTALPDMRQSPQHTLAQEPDYITIERQPSPNAMTNGDKVRNLSSSSEHTVENSMKSRRSSSNTSGTTHQVANLIPKQTNSRERSAKPASRASSVGSDMDSDERFARELQAAENGLRRRASLKA